jgi:hypothetical protein
MALDRIAVIMAAKGGTPDAITVGDCAELLEIAAGHLCDPNRSPADPIYPSLVWGRPGDARAPVTASHAHRAMSGRRPVGR